MSRDLETLPLPPNPDATDGWSAVFDTAHFGPMSLPLDSLVEFPHGLIGFPRLRRFGVIRPLARRPDSRAAFAWLASVDDPAMCFAAGLVGPGGDLLPDYAPEPAPCTWASLGAAAPGDLVRYLPAIRAGGSGSRGRWELCARCPIFINVASRIGAQCVVLDERVPRRAAVDFESWAAGGGAVEWRTA